MNNILTEISERRSDPQLRSKYLYLSKQNTQLQSEIDSLKAQLDSLKADNEKLISGLDAPGSEGLLPRLRSLEDENFGLKNQLRDSEYRLFISEQIVEYMKVIEEDLRAHYDGRVQDLRFRIEDYVEKIRDLELLKSIPLGGYKDTRFFLVTKNVVSPNFFVAKLELENKQISEQLVLALRENASIKRKVGRALLPGADGSAKTDVPTSPPQTADPTSLAKLTHLLTLLRSQNTVLVKDNACLHEKLAISATKISLMEQGRTQLETRLKRAMSLIDFLSDLLVTPTNKHRLENLYRELAGNQSDLGLERKDFLDRIYKADKDLKEIGLRRSREKFLGLGVNIAKVPVYEERGIRLKRSKSLDGVSLVKAIEGSHHGFVGSYKYGKVRYPKNFDFSTIV